MESIIAPIDAQVIKSELKPEFFLRDTNKAGNQIYIFRAEQSPILMQEVGRLRELSFRTAGGGTGKAVDVDECDLHPDGYTQLIVWDPADEAILGGYRYIIPRSSDAKYVSTAKYFQFSDRFCQDYLPYTIELGRSFIQPDYQVRGGRKGLFALDNLWDGIGTVIVKNPDVRYILGKVTMYGDYNKLARNILIYFLRKHFPDKEKLMTPVYPIEIDIDTEAMQELFPGSTFAEDYKTLSRSIRDFEEIIPPLINSYMQLSPTMKVFDTTLNPDFGNVEETGILITIGDLYKEKVARHFSV